MILYLAEMDDTKVKLDQLKAAREEEAVAATAAAAAAAASAKKPAKGAKAAEPPAPVPVAPPSQEEEEGAVRIRELKKAYREARSRWDTGGGLGHWGGGSGLHVRGAQEHMWSGVRMTSGVAAGR